MGGTIAEWCISVPAPLPNGVWQWCQVLRNGARQVAHPAELGANGASCRNGAALLAHGRRVTRPSDRFTQQYRQHHAAVNCGHVAGTAESAVASPHIQGQTASYISPNANTSLQRHARALISRAGILAGWPCCHGSRGFSHAPVTPYSTRATPAGSQAQLSQ